jgi:hypothetical protein
MCETNHPQKTETMPKNKKPTVRRVPVRDPFTQMACLLEMTQRELNEFLRAHGAPIPKMKLQAAKRAFQVIEKKSIRMEVTIHG